MPIPVGISPPPTPPRKHIRIHLPTALLPYLSEISELDALIDSLRVRGEREYHLHKALTALRPRFIEATGASSLDSNNDPGVALSASRAALVLADEEPLRMSADIEPLRASARISRARGGVRPDYAEGNGDESGSEGPPEAVVEDGEVRPRSIQRWMPREWRMYATQRLSSIGRPTFQRRDPLSAVDELRGGLLDLHGASPLSSHRKQAEGLSGWTREVRAARTVHELNLLMHTLVRHLPPTCFKPNAQLEKAWWPVDTDDGEDAPKASSREKRGEESLPRLESVRHLACTRRRTLWERILELLPIPSLKTGGFLWPPSWRHWPRRRTKSSSDCICSTPRWSSARSKAHLTCAFSCIPTPPSSLPPRPLCFARLRLAAGRRAQY